MNLPINHKIVGSGSESIRYLQRLPLSHRRDSQVRQRRTEVVGSDVAHPSGIVSTKHSEKVDASP